MIDGASGFGNGRVIPAGPLREPVAAAAARCGAAVLIGADALAAAAALPAGLPVLRARLVATETEGLAGRRVLAFAGIGRPDKFFETLAAAGADIVEKLGFADHHPYGLAEMRKIIERAAGQAAVAVTTPKDAVRLPPGLRGQVRVVGVRLAWEDAAALDRLLAGVTG